MPETEDRKLVQKYSRTPEQLAEDIKRMEAAKSQMSRNSGQLDANLLKFNETLDPILDPNTGQPLCWVRRPTQTEWEDITPSELMQYKDANEVPKEIINKYKDHQFIIMAKLIANPVHDAAYWKSHSNLLFQEMFQIHLIDVYRKLGIMVANF